MTRIARLAHCAPALAWIVLLAPGGARAGWELVPGSPAHIQSLAIHPADPREVYLAPGPDGYGVVRSTDGGLTWSPTAAEFWGPYALVFEPPAPQGLWACAGEDGLYRSADHGASWQRRDQGIVFEPGDDLGVADVLVDAADPNHLLAVVWSVFTNELFRSHDAGLSWAAVEAGELDAHRLFQEPWGARGILALSKWSASLSRSADGEEEWMPLGVPGDVSSVPSDVRFVAEAPGAIFVSAYYGVEFQDTSLVQTPGGVFRSLDGGFSWDFASIESGLPFEGAGRMVVDPLPPHAIWAGTPEGPYVSSDLGETWAPAHDGILMVDAQMLAAAVHGGERVLFASGPGGLYRRVDAAASGVRPGGEPEGIAASAGIAVRARPNPAKGAVTVTFSMPADAPVALRIFDARGRHVRTLSEGPRPAGSHDLRWDGRDQGGKPVSPGVYFVRFDCGPRSALDRIVLSR